MVLKIKRVNTDYTLIVFPVMIVISLAGSAGWAALAAPGEHSVIAWMLLSPAGSNPVVWILGVIVTAMYVFILGARPFSLILSIFERVDDGADSDGGPSTVPLPPVSSD